ncbi:MAG: NAD(P)-dependent oxidoreductase [Candidatus Bipolaricaulis sp.]|nr:NAD(P)-dependent oxidoreductase [Candidatus Bipolaricaulis sp.]
MKTDWPKRFASEVELDEFLSRPSPALVERAAELSGGVLVLGIGGKMGHTLGRMAKRALTQAGIQAPVVGVSRFSDPAVERALQQDGIETIRCDLTDRRAIDRLPDLPNVVFMAGRKFGSTGGEALTWAINAYVPGVVADRFRTSRILVFSTGNVYPFVPADSGGATEEERPAPIGEYAQSCLGRERVFQHFSETRRVEITIARLNYAVELRYGVLVDIAEAVWQGRPVDVSMSHVNVIWQGDACDMMLRGILLASSPAEIVNVSGPEAVSVRYAAEGLSERLKRPLRLVGLEAENALLANCQKAVRLLGRPAVDVDRMLDWIAEWVQCGGRMLGKPTHFAEREGRF